MGFRNGSYIKIWEIEDKGNYSIANISISRKNKDTGEYDTEFQEKFVKIVSSAHKMLQGISIPKNGLSVQIKACDVTNKYDAEKKQKYYNFVIFEIESNDNTTVTKVETKPEVELEEDEDLPF
jgi:hypothetical protein